MAGDAPVKRPDAKQPGSVTLIDSPTLRAHLAADILRLATTLLGVAAALLIGAYASGTTAGITSDVQGFYSVLRRLLVAPVNILEGAVTLLVPIVVVFALATRREPRRIIEAIAALGAGLGAALLAAEGARHWGAPELIDSLSITANGMTDVVMPAYLAGIAAMLTTAGRRRMIRSVSVSWAVLWAALAIAAISGFVTLPAALATVLIGRAVGLLARFVTGSSTDRAYGDHLIDGIRRAGFEPKALVRIDSSLDLGPVKVDPVAQTIARTRPGRLYEMTTVEGHHLLVVAIDGDRVAAGSFAKIWRSIRVRGIDTGATLDLRRVAEGTALVSHAARAAGVRTARVLGMAHARDTMLLVYQRPPTCRAFADMAPEDVTDEVIDAIWAEVLRAHKAGITHRLLTSYTVLVCPEEGDELPAVWLTSWDMGEVASSGLSRSIDSVQLIAMIAAKVGADRAVESAFRALPEVEVAALAPFLQGVLLPRSTRIETRSRGRVLRRVREGILKRLPDAPSSPQNVSRFSLRTVLSIGLGVLAGYLVLTTFNFEAIKQSLTGASPWWVAVIAGCTALTFVGSALALIAFSPIKLPFTRAVLAQVAAAYMALAMPAGVGPAFVNHSLLARRGVARPLAVATVALVQVSGVVVTVLGLVVLGLTTGNEGALAAVPSESVLLAIAVVAGSVVLALAFPKVRAWIAAKARPTIRQTWPRLVEVVSQPWRLLLGIAGNLLLTVALIGAFYASLRAFGQNPPIVDVAIVFLLGNAVGTAVPTPGGVGPVEASLAFALTTANVPLAIASSAVIVFRFITFWARIPLGWAAKTYLQKKGEF